MKNIQKMVLDTCKFYFDIREYIEIYKYLSI